MKNEYLYTNQQLMKCYSSHDPDERAVFYVNVMYNAGVVDKSKQVIIGDWIYEWREDND
jgi:hypothetical protein